METFDEPHRHPTSPREDADLHGYSASAIARRAGAGAGARGGGKRTAAAGAILTLDESYGHQLDLAYSAWLHRAPTPAERTTLIAALRSNQVGIGDVYRSLLASPEFYNLAVQASRAA